MRILLALIVLGLLAPASAQTLRDKNGNPIGHCEQQGDRTYFRDNNGTLTAIPPHYPMARPSTATTTAIFAPGKRHDEADSLARYDSGRLRLRL